MINGRGMRCHALTAVIAPLRRGVSTRHGDARLLRATAWQAAPWLQTLSLRFGEASARHLSWWTFWRGLILALAIADLTSCATMSHHAFVEPAKDWQTRSGQLLYRGPKLTLIGEVLVRFSKSGDFELTFSKGPGIALLALRQDAHFADVKGALARMGWTGPVERAPKPLRGWLELRDAFLRSPDRQTLRHVAGTETFLFRF